jgi:putative transposase
MADTYTQIHIHTIFAVKNRQSLITEDFQDRLFKYMISVFRNNGHKVLSINGMPDHIHILFGYRPSQSLSKLIQEVKRDSSEWINKNHLSTNILKYYRIWELNTMQEEFSLK